MWDGGFWAGFKSEESGDYRDNRERGEVDDIYLL